MTCNTSNWTVGEVEQALLDNADFEEAASVSSAKLFAAAARRWLIMRPNSASHQGNSLTLNAQYVADMLERAQAYIAANDAAGGGSVKFLGVNYAR